MSNEKYEKMTHGISEFFAKIENEGVKITNISEVFLLKIYEGLIQKKEQESELEIAKECKHMLMPIIDKKKSNNSDLSAYEPHIKTETLDFFSSLFFQNLQYAINSWDNIEQILLQELKIDNPKDFISEVNRIGNMDDGDGRNELIVDLLSRILKPDTIGKFLVFLATVIFDNIREICAQNCEIIPPSSLLIFFKFVKYIGERYSLRYQERIRFYYYTFKKMENDINFYRDFLERIGITELYANYDIVTLFKKQIEGINDQSNIIFDIFKENGDDMNTEVDKQKIHWMDIIFGVYYLLYQNPQYIVKFGFILMSEIVSPKVQEVIFSEMIKKDYCSLIQYEYEWYCRQTGIKLSLPYQFSNELVNLEAFGIVDYNLDEQTRFPNSKTKDENILLPHMQHYDKSCLYDKTKSVLLKIDSEKADRSELHYGLNLRSDTIEKLYCKLIEENCISSRTDIWLFCYRLTGKGKPQHLKSIEWLSDDDSLVLFVLKLKVSRSKHWKRTQDFFNQKTDFRKIACNITQSGKIDLAKIEKKHNLNKLNRVLDSILAE